MSITIKDVTFNNVPNKRVGTIIPSMLTQSNIQISQSVNDYLNSEDFYKFISSLDIDWGSIQVDENVVIEDTADLINWIKSLKNGGGDGGTVDSNFSNTSTNALLNKIITEVLAKKDYNAASNTGLGIKLFRTDIDGITLPQNSFEASNTIYIIKYDFNLDNKSFTIGANSIIKFDGGSLSNGTLVGNNTVIEASITKIFGNNINIKGTWNIEKSYPQWFGVYPNERKDLKPILLKLIGDPNGSTATPPTFTGFGCKVYISRGEWYMSQLLLAGYKGVHLEGENKGYADEITVIHPYQQGQHYILKLGGKDDFSDPGSNADYHSYAFRNFIIDGLKFSINDDYVLSEASNNYVSSAALCFDWAVDGYVNVSFFSVGSRCLYVANTWEVLFDYVKLYGAYINPEMSALYFGTAYTYTQFSNITAVIFNNLVGEDVSGKVIDCAVGALGEHANIGSLVIHNIEYEDGSSNRSVDSTNLDDILNGIRERNILYKFNISGEITIGSIVASFGGQKIYRVGNQNTLYITGLINVLDGNINKISIGRVIINDMPYTMIKSHCSNGSELTIDSLYVSKWVSVNEYGRIYIDNGTIGPIEHDFLANEGYGLSTNRIYINKCDSIINPDYIINYNRFYVDKSNMNELFPIIQANNGMAPTNYKDSNGDLVECIGCIREGMNNTFTSPRKIRITNKTHLKFDIGLVGYGMDEYGQGGTDQVQIIYYRKKRTGDSGVSPYIELFTDTIKFYSTTTRTVTYYPIRNLSDYDSCAFFQIKVMAPFCLISLEAVDLHEGTTDLRPKQCPVGYTYFDTQIGRMLYYDESEGFVETVDSNFLPNSNNALKNKVLTEVIAKKDYNAENKTGLGIKLFRTDTDGTTLPNTSFETPNTIYIIKYDFDLNGEQATIGANSIIRFDGGSLSNGTLIGNDTIIEASLTKIFDPTITLAGTWNVDEAYPEWFGAKGDGINNDTNYINTCVNNFPDKTISFLNNIYNLSSTIYFNATNSIRISPNATLKAVETFETLLVLQAETGYYENISSIYGGGCINGNDKVQTVCMILAKANIRNIKVINFGSIGLDISSYVFVSNIQIDNDLGNTKHRSLGTAIKNTGNDTHYKTIYIHGVKIGFDNNAFYFVEDTHVCSGEGNLKGTIAFKDSGRGWYENIYIDSMEIGFELSGDQGCHIGNSMCFNWWNNQTIIDHNLVPYLFDLSNVDSTYSFCINGFSFTNLFNTASNAHTIKLGNEDNLYPQNCSLTVESDYYLLSKVNHLSGFAFQDKTLRLYNGSLNQTDKRYLKIGTVILGNQYAIINLELKIDECGADAFHEVFHLNIGNETLEGYGESKTSIHTVGALLVSGVYQASVDGVDRYCRDLFCEHGIEDGWSTIDIKYSYAAKGNSTFCPLISKVSDSLPENTWTRLVAYSNINFKETTNTEHVRIGDYYYDTTSGQPMYWNGSAWVAATGA